MYSLVEIEVKNHQKRPMFPFNSQKGFTLVELITSMAIIAVLAGVAIQQYSQYKIKGYDAHSKQALHDINLLCNAYWTDTVPEQECDLAKSKEYGFVQHSDVVATLPSSPLDTFCASAKHNSSPNTYSIDSASLIFSGSDCTEAGGSVQIVSVSEDADCTIRQRRHSATSVSYEQYYDLSRSPSPRLGDLIVNEYSTRAGRQLQVNIPFTLEQEHARDAEEAEYYKSNGRSDEITNYCPVTNWEALNRNCGKPEGCTMQQRKDELIEKYGQRKGFIVPYEPIIG